MKRGERELFASVDAVPTKERFGDMEGLFVPQFSAFDARNRVDFAATKEHGAWLIEQGVNGLVPFGTFGEGSSLSLNEKRRITLDLIGVVKGKSLMPTLISNSLGEIWEYLEFAQDLPLSAIMVLPPSYLRPVSDQRLIEFYEDVASRTVHPIIAYNIPATAITIPSSVAARIPIWGVKDSSGVIESAKDFLDSKVKVLIGSDALLVDAMAMGASGGICGLANLFPRQMSSVYRNFRDGKIDQARATVTAVLKALSLFSRPDYSGAETISAIKQVANLVNPVNIGAMRLPVSVSSLSPTEKKNVLEAFEQLNL
jgi:4-hydroxy-tetrahydrodipicolinate synthase